MKRILIADDEIHLRELLVALFTRRGFDVVSCADGEEVLQQLDVEHPIDAVVMDLLLPYVDGFDLIKQLRQHPKTRATPLIILTDLSGEDDVIEAFQYSVNDILSKPFQPRELIARVLRWIDQAPLPPLAKESI
ncbi:MAG: response regulator transcription factor [Idiomarina sp.]|nr:response regulator transcription factor [Idiomarina sp.]